MQTYSRAKNVQHSFEKHEQEFYKQYKHWQNKGFTPSGEFLALKFNKKKEI